MVTDKDIELAGFKLSTSVVKLGLLSLPLRRGAQEDPDCPEEMKELIQELDNALTWANELAGLYAARRHERNPAVQQAEVATELAAMTSEEKQDLIKQVMQIPTATDIPNT